MLDKVWLCSNHVFRKDISERKRNRIVETTSNGILIRGKLERSIQVAFSTKWIFLLRVLLFSSFLFCPGKSFETPLEFLTFELLHRLIDESRIEISSFEFSIEFIIIFVEKGFFNIISYVICRRYGTSVVNCRESRMRKLKGLNLTENSKNW